MIIKESLKKYIIISTIFIGSCFINTQWTKADMMPFDSGIILQNDGVQEIRAIQESSDMEVSLDSGAEMASRGAISKGNEVVNYAYKFLGKPYAYGATGPNAFDCSGLTQYVYNKFGVNISRTTYSQVNEGMKVDKNSLKAGDLVFFNTQGSISHVGIYIGNGQFIHAPRRGQPVMVSSLSDGYYSQRYATARRIFN